MRPDPFDAVILDLDGVVTQTARVHARAWKQMFDGYLQQRQERTGESYAPFRIETDYPQWVDGKPRTDGLRSFLQSRGIDLPDGDPDDPPDAETISGLGNRKNALYRDLLDQHGVDVYQDAVEQIGRWRNRGLKTAIISSSKNCLPVLEAAGLRDLFDVKVDGVDSERLQLKGKPAPDVFLEAARQLAVRPARAAVVEDALAGVQAAIAGGFGTVIAVARDGEAEALRSRGAHRVVQSLDELEERVSQRQNARSHAAPPSARDHAGAIHARLAEHQLALFLDYDGTLTPIVRRPEQAALSDAMRGVLRELANRCTVGIISGRDLDDLRQMVRLEPLVYAGSHGFDIVGPEGLRRQQQDAVTRLPSLDQAEQALREQLQPVAGAWVERKRFALAAHYREVADEDVERVREAVERVVAEHEDLRPREGKKIFELQPDVEWDKGRAVIWLLSTLGLDHPSILPVYIGDDTTDEDAFQSLHDRGLGIVVGAPVSHTRAHYSLRDTDEVEAFLRDLIAWC